MKTARIGEMHTKITVKSLTSAMDADGYPTETWANVFGGTNKGLVQLDKRARNGSL